MRRLENISVVRIQERWAGYVACMEKFRKASTTLVDKRKENILLRRSRFRWEHNNNNNKWPVGIATCYGLDGPRIESRLGRYFPHGVPGQSGVRRPSRDCNGMNFGRRLLKLKEKRVEIKFAEMMCH